jgi:hypothetical protein
MTKILFMLSILALVGYGCNKHEQKTSTTPMGPREEQQLDNNSRTAPDTSMGTEAPAVEDKNLDSNMGSGTKMIDERIDRDSTLDDQQRMEKNSQDVEDNMLDESEDVETH